jgi:hypothetical protein
MGSAVPARSEEAQVISLRSKRTVTEIRIYDHHHAQLDDWKGRVRFQAWHTDLVDFEDTETKSLVIRSWIAYPHNAIACFAQRAIREIAGIKVLGELQGRMVNVAGYGRPDLKDREEHNLVECGGTEFKKLAWAMDHRRVFWWAGTLLRYRLWQRAFESKVEPPRRGRFVLVKFTRSKGCADNLHGSWCLTVEKS